MSNQIQTQTRIRAIADDLEKGISNPEIISHYCPLWDVSERTMKRYLALAKDVVMGRLEDMDAIIEAVRGEVISEEAVQNLRSGLELEAQMLAIIEGGLEVNKVVTRPEGITETKVKPNPAHVLKAIDMIWKRRGFYAKHKQDSGKTEETTIMPVIKVANEEQKKLVEKIINLP